MSKKNHIYWEIVFGEALKDTINSPTFYPDTFNTKQEALAIIDTEFTNRNKNDSLDEHWNNIPVAIRKVTIIKSNFEIIKNKEKRHNNVK